jgi:hypothetical protein
MLLTIPCINANNTLNDNQTNYDNLSYNDSLNQLFNKFSNKYNNSNNHTLLSFKNNDIEKIEVEADSKKLNKTRPIYFAMDHVNSNDREICDTITNKLKQEGFNVVSAEIGPNKMSQNTRKLYDQNISNAIIFHLFNGVDPSTIRELAKNGNDNRGRIVRNNGNDVILAWFYDSADCVNENGTATTYVYGSETGPSMENPKQYMIDNEIIAICTSSDNGKHKEDADYTGEQTVTEFIKLFHE